MQNSNLTTGEIYHIFNRGNNKREIFLEKYDLNRFFLSMQEFNSEDPIGSIFEHQFKKEKPKSNTRLVEFVCYCLNPNHYHFAVKQLIDNGITKFMHRLSTGYTKYFNQKHENSGALFQGRYKFKHIDTNEYLLHLSAYINLNPEAHQLGRSTSKLSWEEYINPDKNSGICNKEIIMSQFKNIAAYEKFAKDSLKIIKEEKELKKQLLGS